MGALHFIWAEITGRCQLTCAHCYAESGPFGTHGTMGHDDWLRLIDDAAELGTQMIQFIGGEPTLHPALPELVDHALDSGLEVEVFTNLVRVTPRMWETFSRPRIRLATSFYADGVDQHEAITGRQGSYARTKANIAEAVRRSIPLRVGLIDVTEGQRIRQARQELVDLGVTDIGMDRLRQVGRGVRDRAPDVSQLCGACAQGKVAVASNGEVWPCVFARWMSMGNVRETPLADIVTDSALTMAQKKIGKPSRPQKCDPDSRCNPSGSDCNPHCPPGYHSDPKKCWPY
ncbi:MAG: radical SAM protein, partial [Pseudonocardiaceae bacterium]